MSNEARNAKILSLRGKQSMGLIAKELGISRNVVAGVFFRSDWPVDVRVPSPGGHPSRNKIGSGVRGGPHPYAKKTLPHAGGRPSGATA